MEPKIDEPRRHFFRGVDDEELNMRVWDAGQTCLEASKEMRLHDGSDPGGEAKCYKKICRGVEFGLAAVAELRSREIRSVREDALKRR